MCALEQRRSLYLPPGETGCSPLGSPSQATLPTSRPQPNLLRRLWRSHRSAGACLKFPVVLPVARRMPRPAGARKRIPRVVVERIGWAHSILPHQKALAFT